MKNCPICNNEIDYTDQCVIFHKRFYYVKCTNCGMRGPKCTNIQEARDHWNNIAKYYQEGIKLNKEKLIREKIINDRSGECRHCDGTGEVYYPGEGGMQNCRECKGSGRYKKEVA